MMDVRVARVPLPTLTPTTAVAAVLRKIPEYHTIPATSATMMQPPQFCTTEEDESKAGNALARSAGGAVTWLMSAVARRYSLSNVHHVLPCGTPDTSWSSRLKQSTSNECGERMAVRTRSYVGIGKARVRTSATSKKRYARRGRRIYGSIKIGPRKRSSHRSSRKDCLGV